MKKRILIIGLLLITCALLVFGAYRIDILLNGERLPISNEIPKKAEFSRSDIENHEYAILEIENNEEKIREIISFLKNIRYENCEPSGRDSDQIYSIKLHYAHYLAFLVVFPDGIKIWGDADNTILYYAKDPEKLQEEAARLDRLILGE